MTTATKHTVAIAPRIAANSKGVAYASAIFICTQAQPQMTPVATSARTCLSSDLSPAVTAGELSLSQDVSAHRVQDGIGLAIRADFGELVDAERVDGENIMVRRLALWGTRPGITVR